jgi:hypothetical protein
MPLVVSAMVPLRLAGGRRWTQADCGVDGGYGLARAWNPSWMMVRAEHRWSARQRPGGLPLARPASQRAAIPALAVYLPRATHSSHGGAATDLLDARKAMDVAWCARQRVGEPALWSQAASLSRIYPSTRQFHAVAPLKQRVVPTCRHRQASGAASGSRTGGTAVTVAASPEAAGCPRAPPPAPCHSQPAGHLSRCA